ncbi:hypothetical protein CVD28_03240 [Bacillus sp. M6-12]|uniref:hypothetical protein n=1 Tax=Bacillus sp. M6-12 TaxID=2054166 RepID=UPI000C7838B8|nr:hypothetical protein [Bacillus sp. M6-12]PLS19444.1 hypothetical protein CVD28_03240 [Bacillus sp. M6-12]
MENYYQIDGDIAIIDVPYKDTIVRLTIDKEDLSIARSIHGRWILIYKDTDKSYFYFISNQDKSIYLHKLLLGAGEEDKVYFRDKDHTNLRKLNLTLNTYEADESFRQKKREGYKNMSEQGRENLMKGIKQNRYSKNWSDKLSTTKKGQNNPQTILNPSIVRTIREEYALRHFTQKALADYYNVGRTTIADIVNYRTWNEIGENPNKEYRIYKENELIPLNLKETPIQEHVFTNVDISKEDFVIELQGSGALQYIFCQKIGEIKLYVEVRNSKKEFVHSFEVVFPEFLTPQHIHNYVIAQRKPVRYMNRHGIHSYMQIISTLLFGESYDQDIQLAMKL